MRVVWLLLCGACLSKPDAPPALPIDAAIDAPDAYIPDAALPFCIGSGFAAFCLATPSMPLTYDMATAIDTKDCMGGVLTHPTMDLTTVCVFTGTSITINAPVTVTGQFPLVFAASGAITINNVLDVGSIRGMPAGPGANSCQAATVPNQHGGGGGGGFGGNGGNGGTGFSQAGTAGTAAIMPAKIGTGCRGGANQNGVVPGGSSGGAVYLLAPQTVDISMSGVVKAGGAGGGGGQVNHGASGGGAGGMIGIDTASFTNMGLLCANGGGGGGGADLNTAGADGGNGCANGINFAPGGGRASTNATTGGAGSYLASSAGASVTTAATIGAGGGGGGAGYILVHASATAIGITSPMVTPN